MYPKTSRALITKSLMRLKFSLLRAARFQLQKLVNK